MRVNERTAISTSRLLLVPYSRHHVPIYHEWMQDPDLQTATASEPLKLEEEYAMQRSWRADHDKLTFIICRPFEPSISPSRVSPEQHDHPGRMIGDINLFLLESDDGVYDEEEQQPVIANIKSLVGEIELMIAQKDQRRKGYGRTALLVFIDYILSSWPLISQEYSAGLGKDASGTCNLTFLRVKIHHTNTGSIHLFKSLGFSATSEEPNYFGEIELRWQPDKNTLWAQHAWEEQCMLEYR